MFVWDLACQRNSLEHGSPRSASHVSAFAPSWAQRKIARRTERREFRRARRLVVEELETIERHLDLLSENRHVPIFDADRMLPTTAWDTYREVLATALADDDWDGLPVVLGTMEQHRRLLMSQPPEPNLQARDYRRSPRARHLLDKHASSSRARSRKQIDPHHSRFRFDTTSFQGRHHERVRLRCQVGTELPGGQLTSAASSVAGYARGTHNRSVKRQSTWDLVGS